MCCYFWKDKITQEPYIGFAGGKNIEHPTLEMGNRTQIKIFRISPTKDIDIDTLNELLNAAKTLIDIKLNQL